MSQKKGRPQSDNSKDIMFRVRIDKETANKLEAVSNELNITKSEVVRNGIENEYQKVINKNKAIPSPPRNRLLYQL